MAWQIEKGPIHNLAYGLQTFAFSRLSCISRPCKAFILQPIFTMSSQALTTSVMDASTRDRHRRVAIHHATMLQQRKEMEQEILESIETLIDYPTAANTTAAHPSAADVSTFRTLCALFSTSDFDDLVVERKAANKCGYVFCPRPCPCDTSTRGGYYRVVRADRDAKLVPREQLETWCSKECTKRAMFIKVQLSELAAWERSAAKTVTPIRILRENEAEDDALLWQSMKELQLDDSAERRMLQAMRELALDRNDKVDSARMKMVMTANVCEKSTMGPAQPPTNTEVDDAIEGYVPKLRSGRSGHTQGEQDDDWDLFGAP